MFAAHATKGPICDLKKWVSSSLTLRCKKKRVYNALVLPHLDYCCVVWQDCGKVLQQKLERIQNYGMRLICAQPPRIPSEDLRKSLRWTSLVECREIFRSTHIHRCIHNQVPCYLSDSVRTNESCGNRFTRTLQKLNLRMVHTNIGRNSTYFLGAQRWNSLPANLWEMENIRSFKANLRFHFNQSLTCLWTAVCT